MRFDDAIIIRRDGTEDLTNWRPKFEWTDKDGLERTGRNQLTDSKYSQLLSHLLACPKPVRKCADCWLLYKNIGTEEWDRLMGELYAEIQ